MTEFNPSKEQLRVVRLKARKEDPAALSLMGDFHMTGAGGVRQDEKRALRYFRRAADGGLPEAQFKAARLLVDMAAAGETGQTPLERYTDAAQYAHRAAIGGQKEGWPLLEEICNVMTPLAEDGALNGTFADAATAGGIVRDIRRLLDNRNGGCRSAMAARTATL